MKTNKLELIKYNGKDYYRVVQNIIHSVEDCPDTRPCEHFESWARQKGKYTFECPVCGKYYFHRSYGFVSINGEWLSVLHAEYGKTYWEVTGTYDPDGYYKRRHTPISPELRKRVLERDNYTCQSCGSTHQLSLDHIIPVVEGGESELNNLQVLCRTCNASKKNGKLFRVGDTVTFLGRHNEERKGIIVKIDFDSRPRVAHIEVIGKNGKRRINKYRQPVRRIRPFSNLKLV